LSSSWGFVKQLLPFLDFCSTFVGLVELLNELVCVKDTVIRFPGVVCIAVALPFDVEGKLLATDWWLEYLLDNVLNKVIDDYGWLRKREHLWRKEWRNIWLKESLVESVMDLLLLSRLGYLYFVGLSADALDNFEWSKAKIFELLGRSFDSQVPTVKPNKLTLFVPFMIIYVLVGLLLHASFSIFESRLNFLEGLLALHGTFGGGGYIHLSTRVIAIIRMLTINRHERKNACGGVRFVVVAELRAPEPLVPIVLVIWTPYLQVHLKLLVIVLDLAIGLRVISHGQVTLNTFKLVQRLGELGDKLGSVVGDEAAGHAKVGVCIVVK
jgi:hypothetical protein